MTPPVVLASASRTRAVMLENAGVSLTCRPALVDEDAIREAMVHERAPARDIADMLAELKARAVSHQMPDALVIGADQLLVKDGEIFSKAKTRPEAEATLKALSGGEHTLLSAAVIYKGGEAVWRHVDEAKLKVRPLSQAFIDSYLDAVGDAAYDSVGCYQLEGRGAQLFNAVRGDFFTILGLPLLPVLDFLRRRGILPL